MSFFQRWGRALVSFFTSPRAQAVEKEIAAAAVPVAEAAVEKVAATNPTVAVVEAIAEPVIQTELTKGNP